MNQTPMYIGFFSIAGLAQYGALLLNINTKSQVWKAGIYIGMIGSAYSAGASAIPRFELFPCLVFAGAIAFMLTCVVGSYYYAPVPDAYTKAQREELTRTKHKALLQLGVGLGITIAVCTCASFIEGQKDDNKVQTAFASVVYRLGDEVKSLHKAVNDLSKKVSDLEKKSDDSAHKDSVARKTVIGNQERVLKKLDKRRK